MCPTCPFVQVEVKKAEPRDSKAPGQLGPGQWAPRGILSAANGWTTQPAQGWQQPYGPQGEWEQVPDLRERCSPLRKTSSSSKCLGALNSEGSRHVLSVEH